MPINTGLAHFSNDVLMAAVAIYAVAMLAYACDFAFGKKQAPAAGPDAGAGRRRAAKRPGPGRRTGRDRGQRRRAANGVAGTTTDGPCPSRPGRRHRRMATRPDQAAQQASATRWIAARSVAG